MSGSIMGNFLAALYYLTFQAGSIYVAWHYFKKETFLTRILLGSVFGSFLFHWLPTLTSLIFQFTTISHIVALVLFAILACLAGYYCFKHPVKTEVIKKEPQKLTIQTVLPFLVIFVTFIYFFVTLMNHTIPANKNGGLDAGQCSFGDMNMHFAFVTSIANQKTFPPDYSLLPGTKLSYPFLSDSVSSSLYIWGSSLRFAYIFPMLFACMQLFLGFYNLALTITKDKAKATISWIFFFFNGGLGFLYFIDLLKDDPSKFSSIFTGFYTTPTNYNDMNIRWSNIIVDMLLPQRATLFGWAMLFPTIFLLYRAYHSRKTSDFAIAAVLAGGLPMIHTHSFLALGITCLVWLTYQIYFHGKEGWEEKTPKLEYVLLGGGLLFLSFIQYQHMFVSEYPEKTLFLIGVIGVIFAVILCIYGILQKINTKEGKLTIKNWGIFLAIVCLLALPQLFTWTFSQVSGGTFLRGHFGWSNEKDLYLWYYIKNLGVVYIAALAALFCGKRKVFFLGAPAMLICFIAEFIVFQPNTYDNNKLLYVAYAFLCVIAAEYLVNIFYNMKKTPLKYISATCILALSIISALLTMKREYVSNYELYNADEIAISKYIEENSDPTATVMTDTRHNNGIAALTGRNLVCGSSTFLYFHGLDYGTQEADLKIMYEDPANHLDLLEKYSVDYIVVSSYERSSYEGLDEATIASLFELVYTSGDANIYQVNAK